MKKLDLTAWVERSERLRNAIEAGDIIEDAGQQWIEKDWLPVAQQIVPKDTYELHDSLGGAVNPQSIRVYATAPHAGYVNDGTSTHRAQPYLEPSVKRTIEKLRRRVQNEMRKRFQ